MEIIVTLYLHFVALFMSSTATFVCPSLFNWYPDSKDCTKFYRCVWGKGQSFTCPKGTLWSHDLLTCDFKDHVKCGKSSESKIVNDGQYENDINLESSPDFSVDFEIDLQLHNDSNKDDAHEENSLQNVVYETPEIETFKQDHNEIKTIDAYSLMKPLDVSHEHQHQSHYNTEPHVESTSPSMEKDQGVSTRPPEINTNDYLHENEEITNDDQWEYQYQGRKRKIKHENEHFIHDTHSLHELLEAYLLSHHHAFHQPNYHLINHETPQKDTPLRMKVISETPSAYPLNSANKLLYNEFVLSKLLHHPRLSGKLYKPYTRINTDGTYDVLDVDILSPAYGYTRQYEPYMARKAVPTDPWALADFFRAGYGYKRIFHEQ